MIIHWISEVIVAMENAIFKTWRTEGGEQWMSVNLIALVLIEHIRNL